eukprot:12396372-Karenia_brevis.AAC.1
MVTSGPGTLSRSLTRSQFTGPSQSEVESICLIGFIGGNESLLELAAMWSKQQGKDACRFP